MYHDWWTGRRDRVRLSLLALVTIGLVLSAVGGSPAAPGAQKRGGQLVIAIPGPIETIDPHLRSGLLTQIEIIANIYSQAISYRLVPDPQGTGGTLDHTQIAPLMARSVRMSADKTTLTIRFPSGLKFANGDPIDKDAFDYNFDRIFATRAIAFAALSLGGVTERSQIKVFDDRTIVMTPKKPNDLFSLLIASNNTGVVNPQQAKANATSTDPWSREWLRIRDAGSGPFKLDRLSSNEIVLVRNTNFIDPNQPLLDRIVYRVVPDPTTRVQLLRAGEVDTAYELPLDSISQLERDPNLVVRARPSTKVAFIVMNNSIAPFDDRRVRQALSYAIPYDEIVQAATMGYGQRMLSYVPKGTPGFDAGLFKYNTDPSKAKSMLAQAGHPSGFSTEFFIQAGIAEDERVAVLVQAALRRTGVDVRITKLPTAAYFEQRRLRKLPFYLQTGWITTTADALTHLNWLVRSECCNYADYKNTKVWDIIDKYFLWADQKERMAKIREAQEILMEEAPWILLYQPHYVLVTRKNVQGVYPDSLSNQNRFWLWWKE